MRSKIMWLLMFLGVVFAPLIKLFQRRGHRDAEVEKKGEALKAKVAQVKAEQAARKEATDAAVAKVDASVAVDAAKDPVDLANALIADAQSGSGSDSKG